MGIKVNTYTPTSSIDSSGKAAVTNPPEEKSFQEENGEIIFPTNDFSYIITKNMLESAKPNLLLEGDEIKYDGKVRLLQGMNDAALPWEIAPLIAKKLTSLDVKVILMKNSNHRLSSDEDIVEIKRMLNDFLV